MVNWLIERAKRTPYYNLPGYMNRYWLVPYRSLVPREWGEYDQILDVHRRMVSYDGTGPVEFRERPITWFIQRCNIAARIHEILRSDRERHPHSHPWPYITVILRNRYLEERYDDTGDLISAKWHGPGSILWRSAGSLHRLTIEDGKPVTTLFITFKKRGTWGFQVDGIVIPHHEYLKDRK